MAEATFCPGNRIHGQPFDPGPGFGILAPGITFLLAPTLGQQAGGNDQGATGHHWGG
jgi:hypothetical protein